MWVHSKMKTTFIWISKAMPKGNLMMFIGWAQGQHFVGTANTQLTGTAQFQEDL